MLNNHFRCLLCAAFVAVIFTGLVAGPCLASTSSDFTLVDSNKNGGVSISFSFVTTSAATFEYSTDSGKHWSTIASLGWGGGGTLHSPQFSAGTQITFAVTVDGTRFNTQQATVADLFGNGNGGAAIWVTGTPGKVGFHSAFWTVEQGDTVTKGPAVPVPPSALLFGPGLLGLMGIGSWKRKFLG